MMKHSLYILVTLMVLTGCQQSNKDATVAVEGALPPKIVKFEEVEGLMEEDKGVLQVINFWATWCGPCVKELPYFEASKEKYAQKNVQFTLVSLDFASDFEQKVLPFVKKKQLKSKVWLLDNTDYNSWIDKIDPDWGGEIPATLLVNKKLNIRKFVPNEVTQAALDALIEEALQTQ